MSGESAVTDAAGEMTSPALRTPHNVEHGAGIPYRTSYSYVAPDITRLQAEYERDWHVRHNQLLMIQDQYMPRGRTY